MNTDEPGRVRFIQVRPAGALNSGGGAGCAREPLWRDVVGDVLRRERLAQERTLKDVADAARISMPYLSEIERGRKEASSEVLAAAARSLGLGLADLLALAQDDLVRLAQLRARETRAREMRETRGVRETRAMSVMQAQQQSASSIAGTVGGLPRRAGLCLAA